MSGFEYASAPESKAIANIASSYGLFINGKFVEPKKGKSFNTINPATEELLSKIGYADKLDIDLAVKSARAAFTKVWSKMPAKETSSSKKSCSILARDCNRRTCGLL